MLVTGYEVQRDFVRTKAPPGMVSWYVFKSRFEECNVTHRKTTLRSATAGSITHGEEGPRTSPIATDPLTTYCLLRPALQSRNTALKSRDNKGWRTFPVLISCWTSSGIVAFKSPTSVDQPSVLRLSLRPLLQDVRSQSSTGAPIITQSRSDDRVALDRMRNAANQSARWTCTCLGVHMQASAADAQSCCRLDS
jgi:hypothetical protein